MLKNYGFGRIEAKGKTYADDIKVIDGEPVPDWWRNSGHRLAAADIRDILNADPDILVIGKGHSGNMAVPDSVAETIREAGIELIAENTGSAVETFNRLLDEGKNVAGGFHLTC